jgi:hypothetical protein
MSNRAAAIALTLFLASAQCAYAQAGKAHFKQKGDLIGWLICVGIGLLVFLGVYIASVIFMYKDSKKRSMNVPLWVLLGIFFYPISWIVYLFVRTPLRGKGRRRLDTDEDEEDDRPRRPKRDENDDRDRRRPRRVRDDDVEDRDDDRPRRRRDED